MTTVEQVILIILSAALAIFLILSIVCLILLIKLLGNLRRIIAKAERLADHAEHIKDMFEKTAPVVALGRLVGNITKMYKGGHTKSKRSDDE
ncbi:MAG TPA: hypothetical protein VMR34_02045 [Candidatus Saccharimonadales bacterium]|nr:hypothetical protein [Candidatus Saccharimonadales bacterium]